MMAAALLRLQQVQEEAGEAPPLRRPTARPELVPPPPPSLPGSVED